mgnify:FL=1
MTKEIIENDPYKSAGVDIDAGNKLVDLIKEDVSSTLNNKVLGNIGGFAGLIELGNEFDEPVLVACTDGVGTKVSLAQEYGQLGGIGQDLVAMCVNDLVVCGAKPLFFLDYYAASKLDVSEAAKVIKSIAGACLDSDCALLGGETAEMPGHYVGNNFDLAGFSVGCVEKKKILNKNNVSEGNVLIGVESSGPHSNGFSLIRKIISESERPEDEKKLIALEALNPTILYPRLVSSILKNHKINSISHITGGGLTENLPRSIPDNLSIEIDTKSWEMSSLFNWLKSEGNISNENMYRIFNCGIGMVFIAEVADQEAICNEISKLNFKSYKIGEIKDKSDNKEIVFS